MLIYYFSSSTLAVISVEKFSVIRQIVVYYKIDLRGSFFFYKPSKYIIKVNSRNPRKRCELCSELTIKTPCVFVINFEHILHLFSVSIVDFEQINVYCEVYVKLVLSMSCLIFLHKKT